MTSLLTLFALAGSPAMAEDADSTLGILEQGTEQSVDLDLTAANKPKPRTSSSAKPSSSSSRGSAPPRSGPPPRSTSSSSSPRSSAPPRSGPPPRSTSSSSSSRPPTSHAPATRSGPPTSAPPRSAPPARTRPTTMSGPGSAPPSSRSSERSGTARGDSRTSSSARTGSGDYRNGGRGDVDNRTTTARPAGQNQGRADSHSRANGDRPASRYGSHPSAPPRSHGHHGGHGQYHGTHGHHAHGHGHHGHYRPGHRYYYRPYHGVFVYGPRPVYHRYYVGGEARQEVHEKHMPTRAVDRNGSLAVGLRTGSYLSGYEGGTIYGDFGLGVTARWRPVESFGLEMALTHNNETWNGGTERAQTIIQPSAELFFAPWKRVSPYILTGVTWNARNLDEAYIDGNGREQFLQTRDVLWGPHVGGGIEFAVGQRAALDLELRYVGYLNRADTDPSAGGGLQTTAGFLFHF